LQARFLSPCGSKKRLVPGGWVGVALLRRVPMTVERLMRYPVYREGHLDTLLARVAPHERDTLVVSALITAQAGALPAKRQEGEMCLL